MCLVKSQVGLIALLSEFYCSKSQLILVLFIYFLHTLSKKILISAKLAVAKIDQRDLCLAECIVNLSIFWIKSFLLIALARVVLCFVQQTGIKLPLIQQDTQILLAKGPTKNRWSLLSIQPHKNTHKVSPVYPHLSSLSLIVNLFFIANHPMKLCLGIASRNQRFFHQSTSNSFYSNFIIGGSTTVAARACCQKYNHLIHYYIDACATCAN